MSKRNSDDTRQERVLAKPLIQAGLLRKPGETVRLRPGQIERLEVDGYFEAAARANKPKAAAKEDAKTAERETDT